VEFNIPDEAKEIIERRKGKDGKLIIKSLAKGNPDFRKSISSVTVLGYGKLKVRQTSAGLEVTLPEKPCNEIAPVLRISK
jgi:alpha-L-fucosidase